MGGVLPGIGPAPRLAGQHATYLRETMESYVNGERTNSAIMAGLMAGFGADARTGAADALSRLGAP